LRRLSTHVAALCARGATLRSTQLPPLPTLMTLWSMRQCGSGLIVYPPVPYADNKHNRRRRLVPGDSKCLLSGSVAQRLVHCADAPAQALFRSLRATATRPFRSEGALFPRCASAPGRFAYHALRQRACPRGVACPTSSWRIWSGRAARDSPWVRLIGPDPPPYSPLRRPAREIAML